MSNIILSVLVVTAYLFILIVPCMHTSPFFPQILSYNNILSKQLNIYIIIITKSHQHKSQGKLGTEGSIYHRLVHLHTCSVNNVTHMHIQE